MTAIAPGFRLGAYEIVGKLGEGGMGQVEPLCGRERSESPQAKSRPRARRGGGIAC